MSFAPLCVRLCLPCSQGYAAPQPHHRLVSKTQAKWRWCLRDAELAPLVHAVEANPVNPAFLPMTLYRQVNCGA